MGPAKLWVRSQTPLKIQSCLTRAPPRAPLPQRPWDVFPLREGQAFSPGVFHDSFCLEKGGETAPNFKPYRFKVFEIFLPDW